MMACKARLSGDTESEKRILDSTTPAEAKQIGRVITGFDESRWRQHRYDIVVDANEAKFSQHSDLREYLLATNDAILVEASPVDAIWGIGVAADDPRATQPTQWPGLNLLGFALMEVRKRLRVN